MQEIPLFSVEGDLSIEDTVTVEDNGRVMEVYPTGTERDKPLLVDSDGWSYRLRVSSFINCLATARGNNH